MDLTTEQIAIWRLVRTSGIGPVAFRRLLTLCGSADEAVYRLPDLSAAKGRPTHARALADIQQEIDHLDQLGGTPLFWGQRGYPSLLTHLPDPPPMVHVLGNPAFLTEHTLAIVGSRNASAAGLSFTHTLGLELAHAGYTLVSGLARGVDAATHKAALAAGQPTIAVVAGGVDHIYPPENKALREKIIDYGCVLSEQPVGMTVTARHFPRRNRLIAGLARAVIVTEAARKSGTLSTATYAGDYGRDVYAVPGNPADPRAAGTNHLLKQGASLLETAEDLLKILDPFRPFTPAPAVYYTREPEMPGQPSFLNPPPPLEDPDVSDSTGLAALLSPTPIAVDVLIRQSGRPETEVLIELTELELDGRLKRHANGDVSLA